MIGYAIVRSAHPGKSKIFPDDGHSPYHNWKEQNTVCKQPYFVLSNYGTAHCYNTF